MFLTCKCVIKLTDNIQSKYLYYVKPQKASIVAKTDRRDFIKHVCENEKLFELFS